MSDTRRGRPLLVGGVILAAISLSVGGFLALDYRQDRRLEHIAMTISWGELTNSLLTDLEKTENPRRVRDLESFIEQGRTWGFTHNRMQNERIIDEAKKEVAEMRRPILFNGWRQVFEELNMPLH